MKREKSHGRVENAFTGIVSRWRGEGGESVKGHQERKRKRERESFFDKLFRFHEAFFPFFWRKHHEGDM